MDKELLKKIATVILEHYEEDDGYSRDVHALFDTPTDEKTTRTIYGVDLDVVLKSGKNILVFAIVSCEKNSARVGWNRVRYKPSREMEG